MPDVVSANLVKEITAKKKEIGAVLSQTATSAQLNAVGDPINTSGKFLGKLVYNTTSNLLAVAQGPLAADAWRNPATGTVTHNPV
jgi:hypothetical protein